MTADRRDRFTLRDRAEAYAALLRVPNLFTAPPDVLLGAALASTAGLASMLPTLAGLAVASMALYAGGTCLNDYFDAPVDATERPERPIPSGRVSRRSAGALGGSLLLVGVGVAFLSAGPSAGLLAAALAVVVVLYDGLLKGGVLGFLAMGSTRGLNLLLGTIAGGGVALSVPRIAVAAVVTLYIALVTYMAANEATETGRGAVVAAAIGVVVAAAAVLAAVLVARPPAVRSGVALAFLGGFLAWTGSALRPAYADPHPGTVGPAVGACVLGLVVFDAAFAATVGVGWALAVAAFFVPAFGLARAFDVS